MSSLSFSVAVAGEGCKFVSGSRICTRKGKDLRLTGPFKGNQGSWLKHLEQSRVGGGGRGCVVARIKKVRKHEYPWPKEIDPNLQSGHLSYLSSFKPLTKKPKPVTLAFEKPLLDLENKIAEVRKIASETGLDFNDQIDLLEKKYKKVLKYIYTNLKPIQRVQIARHPNRPTFLDHILNITDKWVELHGDRAGYDDPAIVTGIGSIDGKSYVFIGHQKGRNTEENIHRNFGMPTPHGYRKALRIMRYADLHGFPIITMIDTPGAFADLKCEELGQGEAIAVNLREMFGLKVPIVSVVLGEGGSGGALAIGCANKLLMLENAVFFVASPEACATILWKTSQRAPKAAERLKITAQELCKFKIADGIIREPLGGAHKDPAWTSQQIKLAVTKAVAKLEKLDTAQLLQHRHLKFRNIGGFKEGAYVEPEKKRNMKKKEVDVSNVAAEIEAALDNIKKKAHDAKGEVPVPTISPGAIEKLKKEVDREAMDALISMGLEKKLLATKMEIFHSSTGPDRALSPVLQKKVDRLAQEINQGLSPIGSYLGLKQKLKTLSKVNRLAEYREKSEKLNKEINEKLYAQVKGKWEIFQRARDKAAKGELPSKEELEVVEIVKEEIVKVFKSANLEVLGPVRKFQETAELIGKEIEKAVNEGGLRGKIDELKEAVKSNSSKKRVIKLEKEITKRILSLLDEEELKKKVESLDEEFPVEALVSEENASLVHGSE